MKSEKEIREAYELFTLGVAVLSGDKESPAFLAMVAIYDTLAYVLNKKSSMDEIIKKLKSDIERITQEFEGRVKKHNAN